jgi:LMBR1 domain-containing protein 1
VKGKFEAIDEFMRLFELELQYNETNPIVFWLKLPLGLLFFVTSLLWVVQILFGLLIKRSDGKPLIPFLNELFTYLQTHNAAFVATILYGFLVLYLLWCLQKGNFKVGLQIPFLVRLHPMKENETWMNSFLVNIILLLLGSVAVTQFSAQCFQNYARLTEIYSMFGLQINYMRFYTYLYQHRIFPIAFLAVAGLSFIYQVYRCCARSDHLEEFKRRQEVQAIWARA